MPTYDYQCTSCEHVFEIFQSMSDEPVKICPLCGEKVRRLISGGTGLIFKGSGYYLTDYVKKEKSNKTQTSKEKSTKVKKDSKPTNSEGTK